MNIGDLFDTDQLLLESAFNPLQITVSLLVTLLMVFFVYFVYRKTYSGVLYSRNFNLTLVITALVVNSIMIGISGNIVLSLGLVGALSIIRFRTAIKDPKDTAYLFWAITIGMINGVAYYELSIISSIFIALVLFFLSHSSDVESNYVLIIKYQEGLYSKIEPVLKKNFKKYVLRSDTNTNGIVERVIEVKFRDQDEEQILREIRGIQGVASCVLLSSDGNFSE